jgi:RHS repeat-associated protein
LSTLRIALAGFKQVVANRQYDLHTIQYAYDGISRLIDADYYPGVNVDGSPFRAYDYAYDPAGNRTQKVVTLDGSPTTTDYTYNALNQLTGDGTNSYTYDDNGNLTSDGVNAYTWDRANRLLGMGGHSYAYNGQGQRVGQTVDSVATQYLLDVQPGLWKVLAATTNGQTERYLHGPLGIHAQEDEAGEWRWMVPDALGSVRGEFDADLDMQAMQDYTPYGDPFGEQGTFDSPFGFTGEPYDENGLLHLRARYYDPEIGRFFQMDTSQQEKNLYQYARSNPVLFKDPTGHLLQVGTPEEMNAGEATDYAMLEGYRANHTSTSLAQFGSECGVPRLDQLGPRSPSQLLQAVTTMMDELVQRNYVRRNWRIVTQRRRPDVAHRFSTTYFILSGEIPYELFKWYSGDIRDEDGNIWFLDEWRNECAHYPDPDICLKAYIYENASENSPDTVRGPVHIDWDHLKEWHSHAYAEEGYNVGDARRFPNITNVKVSKHVFGLAIDVAFRVTGYVKDAWDPQINAVVENHGLSRPFNQELADLGFIPEPEAWHFEFAS